MFQPKEVLIIGYDTYHDSAHKGRSVGGFVSSLNASLTQWFSKVAFHEDQNEMSSKLALNVTGVY